MTSSDTSSFGVSTGENTTPLPSSPKPLPPVGDQHASPNNQAFVEAIASLSYASDLLSNASKAMSSAVESLMLAGSHSRCFDFLTHNHTMSSPKNYAQDWLNRNYSLNPIKEPAETPQTSSLLFEAGFEAGFETRSQGKALPGKNNTNDHPRGANRESDVDQSSVENGSDVSRLKLGHSGGGSDSPVKESAVNVEGPVSGTPVVRPRSPSQLVEFASEQTSDSVESVTSSPKSSGGHITELESTLDETPNQDGQSAQEAFEQSTTQAGALTLYCLGGSAPVENGTATYETTGLAFVEPVAIRPSSSFSSQSNYTARATPTPTQRSSYISQQYIILDEELDVIPLISYLAEFRQSQNTLCFVKEVKMYEALEKMLDRLNTRTVYLLPPGSSSGIRNAAARACDSEDGCLIFCSAYSTLLPLAIRDKSFQTVIHVGWTGNPQLYNQQLNRNGVKRATLILTQNEFDEHELSEDELNEYGYQESPSTARLNDLTLNHKFSEKREAWKGELSDSSNYGLLCEFFEAWISFHYSGPHKRSDWSAIDVANEANKFAKSALLHGNNKVPPRYPVHPVVGRRLSVTSQFVSDYSLEEAVSAKILVVQEYDN